VSRCVQFANYNKPDWVVFLDALPLTWTQKVKKADLYSLVEYCTALTGCFDLCPEKRL